MTDRPLTKPQRRMLGTLWFYRDQWVTPQWLGGRDGSNHSDVLAQLCHRGLVDRLKGCMRHGLRKNQPCACKGSCTYRLSDRGVPVARTLSMLAGDVA